MDGAEYARRVGSRFPALDQDGNGAIDRVDFNRAAAVLLAAFAASFVTPEP
jgi:hypothetical protein